MNKLLLGTAGVSESPGCPWLGSSPRLASSGVQHLLLCCRVREELCSSPQCLQDGHSLHIAPSEICCCHPDFHKELRQDCSLLSLSSHGR